VAAVGHVPLEAEEATFLGRDQWNALRTGRDHAERRFRERHGRDFVGLISSTIVWLRGTTLQGPTFSKVDDALGVVYTHGIAGLVGVSWSESSRTAHD